MANPTNPNRQQYQQRNQQQGRQQHQRQQTLAKQGRQEHKVRDDFGDEWVDKEVESEVVKGANVTVLRGRVAGVSRYWLKMVVNGQTLYVNKAYVVSIKPAEMKDGQGGPNAGEQSFKAR